MHLTRIWEGFTGEIMALCESVSNSTSVFFINISSPEGLAFTVFIPINVKDVYFGSSLIVEIGTLSSGLVYCTFFFN